MSSREYRKEVREAAARWLHARADELHAANSMKAEREIMHKVWFAAFRWMNKQDDT